MSKYDAKSFFIYKTNSILENYDTSNIAFQESLWHTWIAYTEGDLKVFWIVLTLSTHGL